MSDLYEGGKPDARVDPATAAARPSRFRMRYRQLSPDEIKQHDELKASFELVESEIEKLPNGRYKALALTALEASCFWAVKELTS